MTEYRTETVFTWGAPPLKTVGLRPACCSDSAARPGIPVAATPSSVTISTRSRPSWAQS